MIQFSGSYPDNIFPFFFNLSAPCSSNSTAFYFQECLVYSCRNRSYGTVLPFPCYDRCSPLFSLYFENRIFWHFEQYKPYFSDNILYSTATFSLYYFDSWFCWGSFYDPNNTLWTHDKTSCAWGQSCSECCCSCQHISSEVIYHEILHDR